MRKIIHVDCDCFYASIEMRDDSRLRNAPVAVGGSADGRGVVATCNYQARAFGVRSAMPTRQALKLCPDLVIIRPRMDVYREVSEQIHGVFQEFTPYIEPVSLDEAYLDVSEGLSHSGSATRMAQDIRAKVQRQVGITVSAGVAPNKFLAKIASDWRKPNGLYVIVPTAVDEFVRQLPVAKLHGVGQVTASRLERLGLNSCADIRAYDRLLLIKRFGSLGERLWQLAHGIDERPVQMDHRRRSLGVENTFSEDLPNLAACLAVLPELYEQLQKRQERLTADYRASKPFLKLKFHDFTQTTVEQAGAGFMLDDYRALLSAAFARGVKPVRLLGLGVRLQDLRDGPTQLELFARNVHGGA